MDGNIHKLYKNLPSNLRSHTGNSPGPSRAGNNTSSVTRFLFLSGAERPREKSEEKAHDFGAFPNEARPLPPPPAKSGPVCFPLCSSICHGH